MPLSSVASVYVDAESGDGKADVDSGSDGDASPPPAPVFSVDVFRRIGFLYLRIRLQTVGPDPTLPTPIGDGLFGTAPSHQLLTIVLMHLQMRILRRMNLCSSFVVCNACLEIRKIFHLFSREPVSTLRLLYESQPPSAKWSAIRVTD